MAIARDNFLPRTTDASSEVTFTTAYTVSGTNTALVVFVEHSSSSTVNSVTYGGDALTKVDSNTAYGATVVDSWLLVGTKTGSNNIVVTFSSADQGTITVESYTGVALGSSTGGSDAHNKTSWISSTSNRTITTTTVTNNAWIAVLLRANSGSYAASTNVSLQNNVANIALMGDTNAAITPAGATNQTFTQSGAANSGAILTVALKPLATSTPNSNFFMLMSR